MREVKKVLFFTELVNLDTKISNFENINIFFVKKHIANQQFYHIFKTIYLR